MTYLALTIGPIYKTLQNAKKPKELFVSSYVFSYIMREIIKEFKDRKFITPYIKDESVFKQSDIGLFHDRFIFQSQEGDLKKLEVTIEEVISYLAKDLDIEAKAIKEYLQIHYDEYEFDKSANPILEITPYLDTLELFNQVTQDNSFATSLRRKKGERDNFLTADKKIVDDIKKLSWNNYFCIVHADGDNMGKVITHKEDIEKVSKNLFEYANESHELIKDFGGQTIFAGGDDLLFFAPVISKNKTIFELCDEISNGFNTKFQGTKASLSFGVAVAYHKFPLYEALEKSRKLLFVDAKKEPKNSIAFSVTKHSGQTFKAVVHKGEKELYEQFKLFSSNINGGEGMDNFLHSIHHKIDENKKILSLIGKEKEKLQNFFDNYFNHEIHKEYREFFESLIDFMVIAYNHHDSEKALELVYATLRFIKFVQGDKA